QSMWRGFPAPTPGHACGASYNDPPVARSVARRRADDMCELLPIALALVEGRFIRHPLRDPIEEDHHHNGDDRDDDGVDCVNSTLRDGYTKDVSADMHILRQQLLNGGVPGE